MTRNLSSHTHLLQTRSRLSKNSFVQQTLPHFLYTKSYFPLLASPICIFRSPNKSYYLLNSPKSVHSDRSGNSFKLIYTSPLLCTLSPLQTARTTVSSSRNIQMTSIRSTNSGNGGRNGTSIYNVRTPTTSFMYYALSSDPTKLLTAPNILNGQTHCH